MLKRKPPTTTGQLLDLVFIRAYSLGLQRGAIDQIAGAVPRLHRQIHQAGMTTIIHANCLSFCQTGILG